MSISRDQELWACALEVERKYGGGVSLHTSMEVDRLVAKGQIDAAGVWREVQKRIEVMEAHARRPAQ